MVKARLLFLVIAIFNLIAAIIFSLYFFFNRQPADKSIETNNHTVIEDGNSSFINFYQNLFVLFSLDTKSKEEPLLVVSTNNQTNEQ